MAKQSQKRQGGGGKLRVFFAEFEGSDETIQESLRLIGTAATRTFTAPQVPRYLPPPAQGEVQSDSLDEQPDGFADDDAFDVVAEATPRSQRPKRKAQSLSIVGDLDLRPDGEESFRDFWSAKRPKSQPEQLAVAIYYLELKLKLSGITPNHVYTCFKHVNENLPSSIKAIRIPSDMSASLRNCANRQGWIDTADGKNLKLTQPGENAVEHDLPRKKAE